MSKDPSPPRRAGAANGDTCELYCFNKAVVNRLRRNLPEAQKLQQVEAFFAALGSRTRLLILCCLSQAHELCVCDIANALDMNLSTVSHQLRYLRGVNLVAYRSEGKMAFYRLADARVSAVLRAELGLAEAPVGTAAGHAGPAGS